jgi:putative membrane protein
MWAGMIVFWGLLIWGIYALITSATRRPGPGPKEQGGGARRILDERLARGEIDAEEYRRLRDMIDSDRSDTPVGSERAS